MSGKVKSEVYFSIIIPVFNSQATLRKCLDSIFIQDLLRTEVIVVDNGSSDKTWEFVREKYPLVKIVHNCNNLGAAYARNQGINLAQGKYIIFLDSDTELENSFFRKLNDKLKQLPLSVAAISPKIINVQTKKIFSCGINISSIYRAYDLGKDKLPDTFGEICRIDGPNSCCAIFRKEYLEKIKEKSYFDEDFFFLFEDVDLVFRLKKNGYQSVFLPGLICYHQGNSSNTSKQFRQFLCFRNRWYMVLKYNRGWGLIVFLAKSFLYDFLRTVYFMLSNRYFLRALGEIYRKSKFIKQV